jgi:GNAT superfamily N-acetyltransferase
VPLPTDVVVRQRAAEDLEACVALLRRVHELDHYPIRWPADPLAFITPGSELVTWVAHRGGVLVGHVMLADATEELGRVTPIDGQHVSAEDLVLLRLLFVSPDARRTGLGAHLLDLVTAQASARGRRAALEVLSLNVEAMELYERAGWTACGTTTPYWAPEGTHALLYLAPSGE